MRIDGMDAIFAPRSVAVIGASSDPKRIGGRPVDFLIRHGFDGPILPINPKSPEVQGLTAYPSISEAPLTPDLAVIALPAPLAVQAVEECASRGVRGAVIFSSGFSEVDDAGAALQARMVDIAREGGMRLVGPNCLGIANVRHNLYATFTPGVEKHLPRPGGVSIVSQSGAFGSYCMTLVRMRGLGVNLWATTGNSCDVDFADAVAYCAQDDETRVIMGYLEGATDRDRLVEALELARAREKPVVMMKVGRSAVGAEAAQSHTASLAGSDAVYDAAFRQYGVYRAQSVDEMFDVTYACAESASMMQGDRLGLVTVSGGVGVLMADEAEKLKLDVPALPGHAQKKLKEVLPFAGVRNPVDVTAQLVNQIDLLETNMDVLFGDGEIDGAIIFMSTVGLVADLNEAIRTGLERIREKYPGRPMLFCSLTEPDGRAAYERSGFIVFEEPTRAVRAMAALRYFARSFARAGEHDPIPELPDLSPLPDGMVNEIEAKVLLAEAGIAIVRETLARTPEAAAEAAVEMGFPVVLKIASPDILHKSDIGGVALNLRSVEEVRSAGARILELASEKAPDARIDGLVVAEQAAPGLEAILGVTRDPAFGPVVMFGLGGVLVEALGDVSFRVAPFGPAEARRMIDEIHGRKLLDAFRGAPERDIGALADALSRLSAFAAHHGTALETVDVNPMIVGADGQGAVAADCVVIPTGREATDNRA
ncbi:acetate--CoA ligase family protein [Sediminimonas qiaohouensis]|uniref:acetate--CoA ligase family protein n=1 Tax=Sediminimonas qiaohouensis TaxID=552061 RepID=UPI000402ED6F|nr:acetate--CoA ligase family protein [Sediminimonas qiaohouensis]